MGDFRRRRRPSWPLWLGRLGLALVSFVLSAELALSLVPRIVQRNLRLPEPVMDKGAHRVLCIGDSVTAGQGGPPEDAWPARLSAALQARGLPPTRVENLARPGTTARSAADTIRGSSPLGPGDRVLVMTGHNDFVVWRDILNASQEVPRGPLPASGPRHLPRLLRVAWYLVADHEPFGSLSGAATVGFRSAMDRMEAQAREEGFELVLMTYPAPSIDDGEPSGPAELAVAFARVSALQVEINERIRQEALARDLPLIDVALALEGMPGTHEDLYFDAIHPKAQVHARIADAVAEALASGTLGPAAGSE